MAHFAQELRRGAAEMGDRLRQLFGGIHVPSLALPAAAQASPASEEVASVQPGAIYQNDYMTLWNDSNDPVSAVLRVVAADRFELKVSQLDSVGGGSAGWITFRSAFIVHDIPDQPHRKRLELRHAKDLKTLDYDESKFERRANLMLGILRRCSWVLMGAFQLELDLKKNQVVCGPRAALLKPFWETTVALVKTTEATMWIFSPQPARVLVTA